MKNAILVLFIWLTGAIMVKAQTDSAAMKAAKGPVDFERLTVIRFSPFHTFDDAFQLSIEAFIDHSYRRSFVFIPLVYWEDTRIKKESGGALEIQYRVYPLGFMKKGPDGKPTIRGFYVAPGVALGYAKLKGYVNYDVNGNRVDLKYDGSTECNWVTPALVFGYQFSILKAGYVDLHVGGGLKINTINSDGPVGRSFYSDRYGDPNIFTRNYQGFLPKVSFTVGIRL